MKKVFVLVVLIIIFLMAGIFWWNNGIGTVDPKDKSYKIFVISPGLGIRKIASDLKAQNLIRDPTVFFLLLKQSGLDKKIQAGDFRLSPSMTAQEIAENLTHGTIDIWITIPEGQRAQEVANTLSQKIPTYDGEWLKLLAENEGYLFPDTYLIPRNADINQIINIMRINFDKKFATLKNNANLSKNQIVIIASMIEREAKYEEDRPLVASVILNRLNISMPLQIDATVQYALGYSKEEKTWWKKNLTLADLKVKSPYNTYENNGLPEAPISNPGLDSLLAVISAPQTNYLYYISDKTGHNHYAETVEEHNLNIKKYRL
jgi:UPF0755 protein